MVSYGSAGAPLTREAVRTSCVNLFATMALVRFAEAGAETKTQNYYYNYNNYYYYSYLYCYYYYCTDIRSAISFERLANNNKILNINLMH